MPSRNAARRERAVQTGFVMRAYRESFVREDGRRGLTQEELLRRMGEVDVEYSERFSHATVSRWESGGTRPALARLQTFGKALNLSPSDVVGLMLMAGVAPDYQAALEAFYGEAPPEEHEPDDDELEAVYSVDDPVVTEIAPAQEFVDGGHVVRELLRFGLYRCLLPGVCVVALGYATVRPGVERRLDADGVHRGGIGLGAGPGLFPVRPRRRPPGVLPDFGVLLIDHPTSAVPPVGLGPLQLLCHRRAFRDPDAVPVVSPVELGVGVRGGADVPRAVAVALLGAAHGHEPLPPGGLGGVSAGGAGLRGGGGDNQYFGVDTACRPAPDCGHGFHHHPGPPGPLPSKSRPGTGGSCFTPFQR